MDNRDVLIVLLSDGVTGVNCVEALQAVATGMALPLIETILSRSFDYFITRTLYSGYFLWLGITLSPHGLSIWVMPWK